MEQQSNRPVNYRKGLIVFEVSQVENFGETNLEVIFSIPGNEGTGRMTWPIRPTGIDPNVWFDVNLKMMELLSAVITTATGSQEVLPL